MIAVIGSNMVDLISYVDRMPLPGETLEAPAFSMGCGGKGANQAVAAAKLGAEVMMLTKVGDDIFGDNTIKNLQAYGIHTDFVEKVAGTSSGVAPIFVDKSSQNSILIIKGANEYQLPADIDKAADHLKKCSLIILQLEVCLETVYAAIDFGKKYHVPVLLNPAPATENLDIEKVAACEFFVPNESELMALTRMPVSTTEEVRLAAEVLLKKGLKNVIVTLGKRGVLWLTGDKEEFVAAHEVAAVDTTGAGDAFIGCFAATYTETGDVLASLKRANAFSALSVQKKGTQISYPSAEELASFLAKA